MLKKVIKPDRSGVSFKYDPLGRRIEKAVTGADSEDVSNPEEKTYSEETESSIGENIWEKVGGVRVKKPNTEMKNLRVVQEDSRSVYAGESGKPKETKEKVANIEKVIRFLWDGNTLLHEWEESEKDNYLKAKSKVDFKADFILKLEKKEEEKTREKAERGQIPPDSLITWIFEDDFIPRGKITEDGSYSIIGDYLVTPVEAYDEDGRKVWERELDIYGRVKTGRKDIYGRTGKETGEKNFIPFRFQGQYEEIGLYYNRFRYYSPEDGCYTQQDPIGLAGGNPTLYGYVGDLNTWIDVFGLECIKNKVLGTERENKVLKKLKEVFGDDKVLRERLLRDVNGKKVVGPNGTGRRIDFAVLDENGKVKYLIEVTSITVSN